MAIFEVENELVFVAISEHASEIVSFKDKKTNTEHMWQGDPAFWSGRNPTLFPMVGSTWNKEVWIDGKCYHMGNHGFTRNSDFVCTEHTKDHITMTLKDTEETRSQYPFSFTLKIRYELVEKTLNINYEITNDNERDMPFNFGLHPAFACPMEESESQEDYRLEFNAVENFPEKVEKINDNAITLKRELLEKTIVLTDPKSTKVTLTNDKHSVEVTAIGYEWLAFWSAKNNAPFVCIEPWHSHSDFEKNEVPFEKREGTILLKPHDVYKTAYSITIE